LGASPPPLGHPPHCDNAVLPNLLKYSDFLDRALIYVEYQTQEKFFVAANDESPNFFLTLSKVIQIRGGKSRDSKKERN